ncbi:hypothetical protein LR48_Vigan01g130000 [Vigna angularis]|uniref:Uncharacterized protein n=1 Tax=Phaseolus angularis TaxID=3914 RepID=A0A0L9TMF9_PHAAN|nr:hypothetical protein LR48_Vigan01g130000 [Vigna angularis]
MSLSLEAPTLAHHFSLSIIRENKSSFSRSSSFQRFSSSNRFPHRSTLTDHHCPIISSTIVLRSFTDPNHDFFPFHRFNRCILLLHRLNPSLPSTLAFSPIKPQPRVLRSSASFRCALMSRMPRGVQISQVSSSPRSVSYQVVFRA